MDKAPSSAHLLRAVVDVLADAQTPLKARDIARRVEHPGDPSDVRREVNQLLYGPLSPVVRKDSSDGWMLTDTPPAFGRRGYPISSWMSSGHI